MKNEDSFKRHLIPVYQSDVYVTGVEISLMMESGTLPKYGCFAYSVIKFAIFLVGYMLFIIGSNKYIMSSLLEQPL